MTGHEALFFDVDFYCFVLCNSETGKEQVACKTAFSVKDFNIKFSFSNRSDDVLLKSFVRRHITIYHIFFLVNVLLILHHDPHLANYFTIFHLYWCWYSFHVKSVPRCQTHPNLHLCLKRMLLFISISPVLLGYLDGGPNFWRYGLSWSGSTRPYWSSFGWAQVWLALRWRLAKSPNHFVLTSAFVTQCWRWLWQRDEWGIKTQQSQNLNNKCFKKIKLALLCMCQ